MTYEEAMKAEIGDTLISVFTTSLYKSGEEFILVERSRDHNGLKNDTGGYFYKRSDRTCYGGNIQDFRYK